MRGALEKFQFANGQILVCWPTFPTQASFRLDVPVLYQLVPTTFWGSQKPKLFQLPATRYSSLPASPEPKSISWVILSSAPAIVSNPLNLGTEYIISAFTSSNWQPYITTINLYQNGDYDTPAIQATLPRPIRKSDILNTRFKIRLDI